MALRNRIRRHGRPLAAAQARALLLAVGLGVWFVWDLKTLIGWKALVRYIDPGDATDRKDAIQVYAVIVAGVVATVTAAVGLANLYLTRKSLEQQRELEAQRAEQQRELAQGTALQSYYEQIGKLITDQDLLNTQRKEIRELARGQTLTVLQEVDGKGKGSLLTFLHGAGLIGPANPAVALAGAPLRGSDLGGANLQGAFLGGTNLQKANLRGAFLQKANLRGADLEQSDLGGAFLREANLQDAFLHRANLQGANLQGANLQGAFLRESDLLAAFLDGADLREADLTGANLRGARITDEQLSTTLSLREAIMPDGSKQS